MKKRLKTGGRKKGTPNKCAQYAHFHLKEYKKAKLVYLLKANDRYKIGRTTNMEMRFKRCIGLCPYPLDLVWTLETIDYAKIEKALHRIYKKKRVHYEWFALSESDVEKIIKIKTIDDLVHLEGLFVDPIANTLQ
jgi:hypothetical protein